MGWLVTEPPNSDSPLWPGTFCSGSTRLPRSVDRPLPFREPVPAAPAAALEVHHVSAALWADQIDDRRDYARVRFSWHRLADAHGCLPMQGCSPEKDSGLRTMRGAAKDRVRRLTCHEYLSLSSAPCWLAAEFVWATCTGYDLARFTILQTQCQVRCTKGANTRCLWHGYLVRDSSAGAGRKNRIRHLPSQVANFVVTPFLSFAKIPPKTVDSLTRLDRESVTDPAFCRAGLRLLRVQCQIGPSNAEKEMSARQAS